MHPSYQYTNLMPAGFNPAGLGGLGFLGKDGVIATWGGSQKTAGEVWIIPGLAGESAPGLPVKIDGPLREALGLRVVDGAIYVLTKPELLKYTRQGDGTWTKSTLAKGWSYNDGQWHHFAFSLIHHGGAFYFNTGTGYPPDNNEDAQRGSLIKVNPASGAIDALVKGLRNANGLAAGPDGELFATDNQGHWVPTNKLVHLKPGRFYGYRTSKNFTPGTTTESPPAIWLPYGNYSNSPSRPILLTEGAYQGQMIAGDVNHGGIQRYFLEKVNGEYQGACFRFSQGIGYGINELVPGPDGSLYVAGIGGGCCGMDGSGNWNYQGQNKGLGRLKPTGTVPFEILAMRSVTEGFELEFTQPANAAAGVPGNYALQTWWYTPTSAYGGNPVGTAPAKVTAARLSADKRKVVLVVENLQVPKVYYVKLSNIAKEGGGAPWSSEAWYTLHKVGPAEPSTALRQARDFTRGLADSFRPGSSAIDLPFNLPYRISLIGLDGRTVSSASGASPGRLSLDAARPGLHLLVGQVGATTIREKVRIH